MRSLSVLRLLTPIVLLSFTYASGAAAQGKPADTKPAGTKPADTKPAEAKPGDTKPADAKPTDWGNAKDADPPPIAPPPPPPWSSDTPTSTSGTQLLPPTQAAQPVAPTVNREAEIALDNRIKMIEERLAGDEKAQKPNEERMAWLRRFKLGGYVQPQMLWQSFNTAASPNLGANGQLPAGISANSIIAKADGTTTNPNFFRMRRARLKAEYMPSDYARMVFEIDPFFGGGTSRETGTIARQVEAQGIAKWSSDVQTEFAMGIFKVPLGYEIIQGDADRPFIERSWGEQNLFPAEFDTGVRATTTALDKKLTVNAAVINGVVMGEKTFTLLPDLNKGKDVMARVNYNFGPIDAGLGAYYGQGQNVDGTNLRFKQFPRWATNFEVAVHETFIKDLGQTRLFAELLFAQNMDRGTKYGFALPAIPASINSDVTDLDERSLFIRLEQDMTEWITVAFRYDYYSPNTAEKDNQRDTYSFVTAVNFTKGLKLMAEFDHAVDNVHRPGAPLPDKQIETFSTVLQARF
jgi:hypothetical protein